MAISPHTLKRTTVSGMAPHSISHKKEMQNILNQENHGSCLLGLKGGSSS
jgi:hypothetical protein